MLVALLLVTAYLGWSRGICTSRRTPTASLPQEHAYIQTLNDLHATFGDKNLIVVGLFPHDGRSSPRRSSRSIAGAHEAHREGPGREPGARAEHRVAAGEGHPRHRRRDRGAADHGDAADRRRGAADVRRRVFDDDLFIGTLVASDGSAAGIQASFELTDEAPDYVSLFRACRRRRRRAGRHVRRDRTRAASSTRRG
jgi:hypothetical protein